VGGGIFFDEFTSLHLGWAGDAHWPCYITGLLLVLSGLALIADPSSSQPTSARVNPVDSPMGGKEGDWTSASPAPTMAKGTMADRHGAHPAPGATPSTGTTLATPESSTTWAQPSSLSRANSRVVRRSRELLGVAENLVVDVLSGGDVLSELSARPEGSTPRALKRELSVREMHARRISKELLVRQNSASMMPSPGGVVFKSAQAQALRRRMDSVPFAAAAIGDCVEPFTSSDSSSESPRMLHSSSSPMPLGNRAMGAVDGELSAMACYRGSMPNHEAPAPDVPLDVEEADIEDVEDLEDEATAVVATDL